MVWPIVIGAFLSGPLWVQAVVLEVSCRLTDLHVAEPQSATTEGLFWRSHSVDPNAYSAGVPSYGDPLRQKFLMGSLRAVAEGRIAYLEVPFEPPGRSDPTVTQRIFLARKVVAGSQCLHEPIGSGFGKLPDELCFAWEKVQGLQTRYQLDGMLADGLTGTRFAIKDRFTGQTLGSHAFVRAIRVEPVVLAALLGL